MPVRSSGYYNNPAIGQAFSNLSDIFAPPSSGDAYNYARAESTRADAARRDKGFAALKGLLDPKTFALLQAGDSGTLSSFPKLDLYNRSTIPGTDPRSLDPSVFAVHGNAANTFQGLDARHTNNLDVQQLKNDGDLKRTVIDAAMAPLGPNETRIVPNDISGSLGVPSTQTGVLEAGQGETLFAPGGSVYRGAPKPLTLSEQQGAAFSQLPPEVQAAIIGSDVKTENVVGPDGNPVVVSRYDAIGQQPFFNSGADAKPQNATGFLNDGTQVPAVQNADGTWRHAQTGAQLPPDVQIYDQGKPTGSLDDIGATNSNITDYRRMQANLTNGEQLSRALRQLVQGNPAASGAAGSIRSAAQDLTQVAKELTLSFGDNPNVIITADVFQNIAAQAGASTDQSYNPVYRQVRAMLLELAYATAQLNNPSGEVSRFALERELEALGQGALGNDQALLAVLDVFDERLARRKASVEALIGRDVDVENPPPQTEAFDPDLLKYMPPEDKALFQ